MNTDNSYSLGSFTLHLGENYYFKKFLLPILVVMGLAFGAAAPFWFTGGFVSNVHLVKADISKFQWPGWGLGSKTIFAFEGQTIQVNVELHEVKQGRMKVYIKEKFFTTYADRDTIRKEIRSPGKETITLKAKRTGIYELEFEVKSDYTSNIDTLTGGKYDLTYSADWDVL